MYKLWLQVGLLSLLVRYTRGLYGRFSEPGFGGQGFLVWGERNDSYTKLTRYFSQGLCVWRLTCSLLEPSPSRSDTLREYCELHDGALEGREDNIKEDGMWEGKGGGEALDRPLHKSMDRQSFNIPNAMTAMTLTLPPQTMPSFSDSHAAWGCFHNELSLVAAWMPFYCYFVCIISSASIVYSFHNGAWKLGRNVMEIA